MLFAACHQDAVWFLILEGPAGCSGCCRALEESFEVFLVVRVRGCLARFWLKAFWRFIVRPRPSA